MFEDGSLQNKKQNKLERVSNKVVLIPPLRLFTVQELCRDEKEILASVLFVRAKLSSIYFK